MGSQIVFKERKPKGYSQMVKAIKDIAGKLPVQPEEMYGHTVSVKTGNVTIKNSDFDLEFHIPFDDDLEANEAELTLYNLSRKTIKNIRKKAKITVAAGYGKDTGIIFSGYISKVKTRVEDVDKVTTVYAIDNSGKEETEVEGVEFAAGTKASAILRKLIERTGLPVAVFEIRRDHTYKDKVTVDGGLMDSIRKYADICGVSAFICKTKAYVCPLDYGENTRFILSPETGLLSEEEFEEETENEEYKDKIKGYELEMLLQHRIQTGSIINLRSVNAKGTFRVREGSHEYDGENFITKVKAIDCPPTGKSTGGNK